MAFDPAEFLAESPEPKKEAAPEAAPAEQPRATESKFNPEEFLSQTETPTSSTPVPTQEPEAAVAQTIAPAAFSAQVGNQLLPVRPGLQGPPAMTAPYGMSQLGINKEALKSVGAPIVEAAKGLSSTYKGIGPAVADLAAMHVGLPPPVASYQGAKGLYNMYNAARAGLSEASNQASQSALTAAKTPGMAYPESVVPYRDMARAAPQLEKQLSEAYGAKTGGPGNNGVKAFLKSPEAQATMKSNPAFAAAAKEYLSVVPSTMAQVGKVVAPVARMAGRVIGPAGLALNAYDAAQYAQDAELGKRLAQGQGQQAQHNFRQLNPGYGAPITPDQAAAVQQNGSQRDIDALIRQKAAQKALGQ